MKYLTFLIVGAVLSGCASSPPNPWTDLDTSIGVAASPIDCGSFPYPTETNDASVVYDKAALNDLDAYRACSEANADLVSEHAQQIGQLKLARKGLTEAGRAQRNIADMKQQMLDDERRHNFFMSIGYWAVIVGLAL